MRRAFILTWAVAVVWFCAYLYLARRHDREIANLRRLHHDIHQAAKRAAQACPERALECAFEVSGVEFGLDEMAGALEDRR